MRRALRLGGLSTPLPLSPETVIVGQAGKIENKVVPATWAHLLYFVVPAGTDVQCCCSVWY